MKKYRLLKGALAASLVTLGYTANVAAEGYAAAYNNILNLSVTSTDADGNNGPFFIPLNAFTSFSVLSSASARRGGLIDPANPPNSDSAGGPADAQPAFGLGSVFPGAPPANNELTPLGQGGDYSRGGAQVITTALIQLSPGGPIAPSGNTTQAWGVADAYVPGTGNADSDSLNGSVTGFNTTVVLAQPAILEFEFDADPYMEVELGPNTVGQANANIDVTFSITSGGETVFEWSPDGQPGGIINGTELLDESNLNGSIEVTQKAETALFDPTGDASGGVQTPATLRSYAARTNILPPGIYTLGLDMVQNVSVRTQEDTRASLGDRVWEDLDADGIQDCTDNGDGIIGGPGDTGPECDKGIPGVSVSLVLNPDSDDDCNSGDESIIDSTVTDADGFYAFENLSSAQDYCVLFDQVSANDQLDCLDIANPGVGAVFSPANQGGLNDVDSDADVNTGQTGNIDLAPLAYDRTWDAGLYCPAKLGDLLIHDLDRDGIQDGGEPGIGGQMVELIRCEDGSQVEVIDTTVTDPGGMYMFNPLPPGEYAVRFSKPDGTVFSAQDQGADDAVDCDTDMDGVTDCIVLGTGEYNSTIDACVNFPPAGLGDRVWEDEDADGVQDLGEPGIEDVTVNLLGPGADGECDTGDEAFIATTTTGANGIYQFLDLDAGRYCVEFIKPDICDPVVGGESAFSPANQGADDAVDSDADTSTGQTGNIDLDPGEYDWTNDGGVYCPAKIGDRVWEDLNENGIQDDGEPGVDGVTINLYDCGDDFTAGTGDDTLVDSMLTGGGDGMYMFSPLNPGNYYVQCIAPEGFTITTQNAGADDTVDSDADPATGIAACTNLESNEYDPTWDCGLVEEPSGGGEGCTPGFWKQPQHFAAWLNPPYAPTTLFSDVFEDAFPGMTLLEVLGQGGGGLIALGRHTVAALLNSATADVSYDYASDADVIAAFNAVYPGGDYESLKNQFAGFNEQGCPINGKDAPSNATALPAPVSAPSETSAPGSGKGKGKGKNK